MRYFPCLAGMMPRHPNGDALPNLNKFEILPLYD